MKVKPILDLRQSPTTSEEGSLLFAKNIKIANDGLITSDYGYNAINSLTGYVIIGHIVGLNNKIYFFTKNNKIIEYDELSKTIVEIQSGWKYNNGIITGSVSTNISGEIILTISEYKDNELIPLKHINLSYCKNTDDESLYTQAPKVSMCNITINGTYAKTIPNGTYIFFVRYKIREGVYTNWYLASNPIFAGTNTHINTLQGSLKYIDYHKDAGKSFILNVDFVNKDYLKYYEAYQIGFLINHDDAVNARIWKTFNTNVDVIYFDYENVKEENIDNLLKTTYQLYNVKNVTNFKNQLYISNYIESDFNKKDLLNNIEVSTVNASINKSNPKLYFNNYELEYDTINNYYKLGNKAITKDNFDYTYNKPSKSTNWSKDNIMSFSIKWTANDDPDLAMVYNVKNNSYHNAIIGPTKEEGYIHRNGIIETYHAKWPNDSKIWFFEKTYEKDDDCYSNVSDLPIGFARNRTFEEYQDNNVSADCTTSGNQRICPLDFDNMSYRPGAQNRNESFSGSGYGWRARDYGFTKEDYEWMRKYMINAIKKHNNAAFTYFTITSNGVEYKINYDDKYDNKFYVPDDKYGMYVATENDNLNDVVISATNSALNFIIDHAVGFTESGLLVINYNNNYIQVNVATLNIKLVIYDVTTSTLQSTDGVWDETFSIKANIYDFQSLLIFNIKKDLLKLPILDSSFKQASTLMPFSKYDVYAHLVDEYGIVSNGVFVKTITTNNISNSQICTLSHKCNITLNNKSYFLSICNVGDLVIEGFDYKKTNKFNILHSIEIDTLLYNLNDNIIIKNSAGRIITENAKYVSSGSNSPIEAFGNCGFVYWTDNDDYSSETLYIIISRHNDKNNDIKEQNPILYKATNYTLVKANNTIEETNGFYGSYYCEVKKPIYEASLNLYVSGKDIYYVNRDTSLILTDFTSAIQEQESKSFIIKSNYNLNYLSLNEDIVDQIFMIGKSNDIRQVAKVINSATLSFIYKLDGMYKDIRNKTFYKASNSNIKEFNNTIRLSNVLSDETFNNSVFMFDSIDYYNIPTNRGIIVNLFSIGNDIFVHTKSSLYKFAANQNIMASDNDIALKESDMFSNGITQICDSQFGYAGIDTKEAGCVTFDMYFFYDRFDNHIFAYGGQANLQIIDHNIYNILSNFNITNCRTMQDEPNNRIFFNFIIDNKHEITISYNYKYKCFVSLHNLTLDKAFNSKNICYTYKNNLYSLFNNTDDINIKSIYGPATSISYITDAEDNSTYKDCLFSISVLLFPNSDGLAVLNSLYYTSDFIKNNILQNNNNLLYNITNNSMTNPVKEMFITTDSCKSTSVIEDVDDTTKWLTNSDINSNKYKGFKYDRGFWVSDYFRNKLNVDNIYKYSNQPGVDIETKKGTATRIPNTDNYSLVYGRYFIITFGFKPKAFKFESININDSII